MSAPTTRSHDSGTSPPSQTTARPYSYGPGIIPPQTPLSVYPTDANNIYAMGEGSDRTAHNRLLPIGYAKSLPLAPGRSPVVSGAGNDQLGMYGPPAHTLRSSGSVQLAVEPVHYRPPDRRASMGSTAHWSHGEPAEPADAYGACMFPVEHDAALYHHAYGSAADVLHQRLKASAAGGSVTPTWGNGNNKHHQIPAFSTVGGLVPQVPYVDGTVVTTSYTGPSSFEEYWVQMRHSSASLRNTCPDSVQFMQEGFPLIGDEPVAETIDAEYASGLHPAGIPLPYATAGGQTDWTLGSDLRHWDIFTTHSDMVHKGSYSTGREAQYTHNGAAAPGGTSLPYNIPDNLDHRDGGHNAPTIDLSNILQPGDGADHHGHPTGSKLRICAAGGTPSYMASRRTSPPPASPSPDMVDGDDLGPTNTQIPHPQPAVFPADPAKSAMSIPPPLDRQGGDAGVEADAERLCGSV
ncbi:hypothetical protein JB92DRAFT_2826890 [Gautieria morchelliformis]|nr:hypothetical protein JB92DRAFT_2826890 [Gautieria morchelliformis]